MSTSPTLKEQEKVKLSLIESISNLRNGLNNLIQIIRSIDTQLKIHIPDLYGELLTYYYDRSGTYNEASRFFHDDMDMLAQENIEALQKIVQKSRMNHELLVKTSESFSEFLAKTFTYKDSF